MAVKKQSYEGAWKKWKSGNGRIWIKIKDRFSSE